MTDKRGQIVIYSAKSGKTKFEVRLENETVWLSQAQMSELFQKNKRTISEHIKNVFSEGELPENSVVRNFRTTGADGKFYNVNHYNLDVIISIGYRVKSQQGTQFRIWATKTLKDYLVQGYAVNQKRLLEQTEKLNELQQTINFIQGKANHPELQGQAQELLRIINEYTNSLTLLHQYDEGKLRIGKGKKPSFVLTPEEAAKLIEQLKSDLIKKGEASALFGQNIHREFEGIIKNIYQTFDKQELYSSIEEKAANLLYLTIKDHPFADGNKRIGSLLFIYFLDKNNYLLKNNAEKKITNNALVALALLVANSDPKEKEVMIKIVINLIKA